MTESVACPVPPEQRPLEEFQQLTESWFFSWPAGANPRLRWRLATAWLLMLPVCTLIASGSWTLRGDPPRLVMAGSVALVLYADASMARLDLCDASPAGGIGGL